HVSSNLGRPGTELRRTRYDDYLRGEETVESCRSSDRRPEHSCEPRKVNGLQRLCGRTNAAKSNNSLIFRPSAGAEQAATDARFGLADSTGALAQQLAAILPGREVEPAFAGAKEAALVGKAEQVGGLGQRELQPAEILFGKLAPGAVQQVDERRFFLFQPALQGALAHA